MACRVPPGFVDLSSATQEEKKILNVIGVVTDLLPPKRTQGKDWMFTFSIDDNTVFGTYNKGQKIRFFGKENALPLIHGPGDVVLLKQVRCMNYYGQMFLVSTIESSWIVFPAPIPQTMPILGHPLKQIRSKAASKPSLADMEYVVALNNNQNRSNFTAPLSHEEKEKFKATKDKFSLIRDVGIDKFYDLVGQVVKVFPRQECVDLYITDYTENGFLYKYGPQKEESKESQADPQTERRWQGPNGKYTLLINTRPPHSYWTRENLNAGDFIRARNVRIKPNYNDNTKIEGSLWEDSKNPDRVNVQLIRDKNDARVQELLTRKHQLGFDHILRCTAPEDTPKSRKRKSEEDHEPDPLTSRRQRRKRKQKLDQKMQKQEQQKQPQASISSNTTTHSDPEPPLSQRSVIRHALKQPNQNIRCKRIDVAERTVAEILASAKPSPNQDSNADSTISRTTVRIVDFKPRSLEDFARLCAPKPSSSENEPESDSDHSVCSLAERQRYANILRSRRIKHEWAFALLLEDARPPSALLDPSSSSSTNGTDSSQSKRDRMIAYVSGADAEFLLNASAQDLRATPQALGQLREKMFLLWGDLEERKGSEGRALRERSGNEDHGKSNGDGKEGGKEAGEEESREKAMTRPFTCCIREYGVQNASGVWERRFGICETTIMQGEEGGGKEDGEVRKRSSRAPIAG